MDLTLNDFQKVSDEVPFLADLKPSGKYVMEDVHKVCQINQNASFLISCISLLLSISTSIKIFSI